MIDVIRGALVSWFCLVFGCCGVTYLGTDYLSVMNDISYFKNDSNTLSEENTL